MSQGGLSSEYFNASMSLHNGILELGQNSLAHLVPSTGSHRCWTEAQ